MCHKSHNYLFERGDVFVVWFRTRGEVVRCGGNGQDNENVHAHARVERLSLGGRGAHQIEPVSYPVILQGYNYIIIYNNQA